jgi:hypothetical protein
MPNKFQIPRGQLLGDKFLTPGSIIEDTSGVYKVTYAPDGSHVGNSFPSFFPGADAIPFNQQSYNTLRTRYQNRRIVTHNDVAAGIVRNTTPFASHLVSGQDENENGWPPPAPTPPYPIVNAFGVVVGYQNTPVTTAYGDHL